MRSLLVRGVSVRVNRSKSATLLLTFCTLGVLACGMPISAAEVTATAAMLSMQQASVLSSGDQASSSASSTSALEPRPTASPTGFGAPLATLAALTTVGTPQTTPTAAVTATAAPTAEATPAPIIAQVSAPAAGSNVELISDLLKAVNAYRAQNGRGPLVFNASLTLAATNYARLLGDRNYFSHDGIDGSTPEFRIRAAGYRGSFRGETLAAGQNSAQAVLIIWQNSPAHSRVLLDPTAIEVGIGYYYSAGGYYGTYWVLDSGSPGAINP
jgi:uncharacterized protein YkwD